MAWYQITGPCLKLQLGWDDQRNHYAVENCADCFYLVYKRVRWRDVDLYSRTKFTTPQYNGLYFSPPYMDGCRSCNINAVTNYIVIIDSSVIWPANDGYIVPSAPGWVLETIGNVVVEGTASCYYKVKMSQVGSSSSWWYNRVSKTVQTYGTRVTNAWKYIYTREQAASYPFEPYPKPGVPVGLTWDELVSADSGFNYLGQPIISRVYNRVYTYKVQKY